MDEVESFVRDLLPAAGDVPFARKTYRKVFLDAAEVDPFATSVAEICAVCERLGVAVPAGFEEGSLDDALDLLLVWHVEPQLGGGVPLFVYDYPASQAALAQVHEGPDSHRTAQRFEFYVEGVELANGYHELLDAAEQRTRFEQANRTRVADGRAELPMDAELLEALAAGMPACAGVALGFDRLMMLATGATEIGDVRFGWALEGGARLPHDLEQSPRPAPLHTVAGRQLADGRQLSERGQPGRRRPPVTAAVKTLARPVKRAPKPPARFLASQRHPRNEEPEACKSHEKATRPATSP